jgi:acetyl-CoA carboxylase biotin carboxylase subunit
MKFKKILIANRGEIAVRIIRACRELDISPVVIFSEADYGSLHVRLADEAYLAGPAPALESYLKQERIIQIARECGAGALHPGYGFLAENAGFAGKVTKAGLVFIGPPAEAMKLSGDKLDARRLVRQHGIPIVPGSETIASEQEAIEIANQMGYPVLLKAAGGGGGKGMRIVHSDAEIPSALRGARHEAKSAFGDDRIYLEKYLIKPRHIEIQILADAHGNCVYLGERECSIQRRHQKLIEESPSTFIDQKLRQKMGRAAVGVAETVGYVNAGTVEFLVDKNRNFYFLEVNARLQVEHPVTEMVTGLDLAKWQIAIAQGEKLDFTQEQIKPSGWAIECRIYAEDFENNFFPCSGRVTDYREPGGPGVRVDSGVVKGSEISLYYDPLIAKLITWGNDRVEAVARMKRGLAEYKIAGVTTTLEFHSQVMQNPRFLKGELSTQLIAEEFIPEKIKYSVEPKELELLAISSALVEFWQAKSISKALVQNGHQKSNWKIQARQTALRNFP